MEKMSSLSNQAREVLGRIALMAALSDGRITDQERILIWEYLASLDDEQRARVYRPVVSRTTSPSEEMASLQSDEAKRLAVKFALKICLADGKFGIPERTFLVQLAIARREEFRTAL